MENQNKPTRRAFSFSGLVALALAILLILITVPVNMIVKYYDFRIDTTPSKMYSLTDTTKKYLDSVKDKQIELYVLAPNVDSVEDFSEDDAALPLYYALKQYKSYSNIKVTCFDPDADPDKAKALNPDGYYNLSGGGVILVKCGDFTHKVTNLFVDDKDSSGNVTGQKYVGENLITGAIKDVTQGNKAIIYFLTGHGEKDIDTYYNKFKANAKNANYELEELDLSKSDAIPSDASIIFVCAPTKDISLEEKNKLMDYAQKGGNLSFFMSPQEGKFRYSNIEDILAEYDITMDYNKVYETNSYMHIPDDQYTINVTLPDATDDMTVDLTKDINSQDGINPYMCASRSFAVFNGDNASVLETASIMQTAKYTGKDGNSNYTAASEVFGGDDADPNPPTGCLDLAFYSFNKQTNSKLTVFGNADFFDDEQVEKGYTIVPLYLCLSTISWMYDSDTDMKISDKNRSYDSMKFSSESEANNTLKIFIIAPCIVAAFGVLVWFRRRSS